MSTILNVENIEKYYGRKGNITKAIDNLSFYVEQGEFISIMGASGSGKTTLLNCISTIDTVSSGHIYLDGTDVTELTDKQIAGFRNKQLGFIFQDYNLLDTLTVEENIALSLVVQDVPANEITMRITKLTRQIGIEQILSKFPMYISGGEKQRCACARAFINHPKIVLADEPTGSLDSVSAQKLLDIMEELNQSEQTTILMVTHDPFTASYANRILFLKDGRIFNEILKGEKSRTTFYHEILDVLSLLGGEAV